MSQVNCDLRERVGKRGSLRIEVLRQSIIRVSLAFMWDISILLVRDFHI